MRILLVRHAEAVSAGDGIADADRYLSGHGRQTARRVAEALAEQQLAPTRILVSPRLRTLQTAEIFAEVLGFTGPIEQLPSLCYTVAAPEAARELTALSGSVLAFGHMPTLAEIGSLLTRGRGPGSFAPSEALLIENGRAVWSIDPDTLTLMRR